MSTLERRVLLAPDSVARAVSARLRDRKARWMLGQPRHVRRSYVEEVLGGRGDREVREQRWMLLQDDPVRLSYVDQVLGK
jgi:hypothetical protein